MAICPGRTGIVRALSPATQARDSGPPATSPKWGFKKLAQSLAGAPGSENGRGFQVVHTAQ